MVDQADPADSPDRAERTASQSDVIADAWTETLGDMQAMATDREGQGYEVVALAAGDTTPLSPDMGESDRWGFSHLIPGDEVADLLDVYEGGEFTDTGVYQRSESGLVFFVTECVDPDSAAIVLIAGSYRMREAPALVRAATDRGVMYSHLRTLDRTYVATFEHDDVAAFFPDPDRFYAYEPGRRG